jgi:hypothetical protein
MPDSRSNPSRGLCEVRPSILEVGCAGGLRVSELVRLRWADVVLRNGGDRDSWGCADQQGMMGAVPLGKGVPARHAKPGDPPTPSACGAAIRHCRMMCLLGKGSERPCG